MSIFEKEPQQWSSAFKTLIRVWETDPPQFSFLLALILSTMKLVAVAVFLSSLIVFSHAQCSCDGRQRPPSPMAKLARDLC